MHGTVAKTGKLPRVFLAAAVTVVAFLAGSVVWSLVYRPPSQARLAPAIAGPVRTDDDDAQPAASQIKVASDADGNSVIVLGDEAVRKSGIESRAAEKVRYQPEVRGYGTIVDLDVLTMLHTNYVTALAQLGTARARLAASKPAYDRAASLYGERTGTVSQMQTAEAAFRADQAALAAAQAQVSALSSNAYEEWGPVIGQAIVDSGPLVDRLIHRDRLLAQVTLRPGVTLTPPPTIALQVQPTNPRIKALFISSATQADPRIQGLSFYYDVPADRGLLPNMNVVAFLPNGPPVDGVRVPKSAVVWWSGHAWVYLRASAGHFSRQALPMDMRAGGDDAFEVPASVFAGKAPVIVIAGAQALLSEEFRSQIQLGGDDD